MTTLLFLWAIFMMLKHWLLL